MALRRFVSIRGYPSKLYSDNGSQLVAANVELRSVIQGLDQKSLKDFGVTQGLQWFFSSADAPWQNGTSEALIKSVKRAITLAIGDGTLTFSELQTLCFEAANLVNEQPIGRHPTLPDDDARKGGQVGIHQEKSKKNQRVLFGVLSLNPWVLLQND